MKRNLVLLASISFVYSVFGQNKAALMRDLENQNTNISQQFDQYFAKRKNTRNTLSTKSNSTIASDYEFLRGRVSFFIEGRPYFLRETDADQIQNINADVLQNGQVTGLSTAFNGTNINVTVFDGGRAFAGHTDFNNAANRVNNKEASTQNISAHATAVTDIIGGKGTNITNGTTSGNTKGMMVNATFNNYMFTTTTLPGNTTSSTVYQKITSAAPNISNHSYGMDMGWDYDRTDKKLKYWNGFYDPSTKKSYDLFGSYLSDDQNYDKIVYDNPNLIIVKAAGNEFGDGPGTGTTNFYYDKNDNAIQFGANDVLPANNCSKGYDCISSGSLAKNIIVVAATNKITTNNKKYVQASDVVHSDYSSAGPRDDGAIKPDIASVGTNIFTASSAEDTTGSSLWSYGSGTSYASPAVTGVIGLWTEINKSLFNGATLDASLAKTLLIHSASEAGAIGPDPIFGWGFANAQKGAELLVGKSNSTLTFEEPTLQNQVKYAMQGTAAGGTPIKVTISWVDPAFNYAKINGTTYQALMNNRTSALVNDLDLRIIDTTTNQVYSPWKLDANNPLAEATTGDNTVDNVEQVVFNTPKAGTIYRIEVSNKRNLVDGNGNAASQKFAIMATGFTGPLTATTAAPSTAPTVQLYPSLATDNVKLDIPFTASEVQLYDMSGRLIKSYTPSPSMTINVSNFQKGVYIFNIITDKGKIVKKFIKQ